MIGSPRTVAVLVITIVGMTAETVSHARDLPRGNALPAARTGCESFGPDFHKLEGSDTCIRISGSVEVDATVRTGSGAGASFFPGTRR